MNGLLVMSTGKQINIGDYIQGLAAAQFFGKIDVYIERENSHHYKGDKCNVIMNGWYMHHPENWPPSPNINPLFVAVHINSAVEKEMLSDESISYFKQHEPIGCRDYNTMNMLKNKGVDAYFSGCLTLTLGRNYKTDKCDGKIYFVDPCCRTDSFSIFKKVRYIFIFLFSMFDILKLLKKDLCKSHPFKKRIQYIVAFYTEYKKLLPKKDILSAEFITHEIPLLKSSKDEQQQYMGYAEELIKRYSKAKLVITSRIHCALPCLGLDTPVIYVDYAEQYEYSSCRLDGLLELLHVARWSSKGSLDIHGINVNLQTLNKSKFNSRVWLSLSEKLTEKCLSFVKRCN